MKKTRKTFLYYLLPVTVLGLVGMGLRIVMLKTGIDDKGLLERFNIPGILLWVLAAGVAGWLFWRLRQLPDGGHYRALFPRSALSGWLSVAGGVLMAAVIVLKMRPDPVWIWVTGFAAAAGMIFAGSCRIRGLHPNFLCHGFICVFFIYQLILNYQDWNADPQLHTYAVQMLASVALMLGSFHRACCDANIFCRRKLGFSLLMALFFCMAALSDQQLGLYYLAAGLWAAGNLCRLDPIPVRPAPADPVPEAVAETAAPSEEEISATSESPEEEEIVAEPEIREESATVEEKPAGDFDLLDDPFFAALLAEKNEETE